MIEKMKQWLEALEQLDGIDTETECVTIDVGDEITSLRQAIADLESQEPVAWIDLQKEAQQIVESKALWKKFIDGTPLANDIACWMTDFALQHTHPPQRTEQEPVVWSKKLTAAQRNELKQIEDCTWEADRNG
jgi:hypothetical protein